MADSASHWLRLRQIALVAEKLAPVEADLCRVLGIEVCFRDPSVATFGLENALMPIGNQLLEVVAPVEAGTAGGRYLDRRGGDGGYMVITQCDDHAPRRARVEELGVRIVGEHTAKSFRHMQLHPRDTGGSFFEIDQMLGEGANDPDGPWFPAGKDWKQARRLERVTGIVGAELQCDDPQRVASRWSEIAQTPLRDELSGPCLPLENASVRFVACTDGRPEGLGAFDVSCADKGAVLEAAQECGAVTGEDEVTLCGTRIHLK
jgi:hypothetical protein